MTWSTTEQPKNVHIVASGPTSTALSCCGRQRTGDESLLPNDDDHQDGMYVGNDVPDDDIDGDVCDSRRQTTA